MNIEIRINGELDYKRMIAGRVKRTASQYGNKIDYFFVNGHWPKQENPA